MQTNTAEKLNPDPMLILDHYRKEKANILLPSQRIEGLSDFHAPVIDTVQLSSDPDDGDIYCQEKSNSDSKPSRYAITGQGIKKLSACAGIMWHPTECKRTDDRKSRDYVSFQAVGGVRKADGSPIYFKAEYDLDFEVIEEEITTGYEKKRKDYKGRSWFDKMTVEQQDEYINGCINRDLLQKRKHKMKLAETGAMLRVARSLLGLKSTYTLEEIKRPFVVVRIVLRPDYKDPDVKKAMLAAAVTSMTQLYGGSGPAAALPAPADFPKGEVIDLPPETDQDPVDEIPEGNPGEPTEEEKLAIAREEFLLQDTAGQIAMLDELVKRKAYDTKQLKKPLKDFDKQNRIGFYDRLMTMPDAEDLFA